MTLSHTTPLQTNNKTAAFAEPGLVLAWQQDLCLDRFTLALCFTAVLCLWMVDQMWDKFREGMD